MTGRLYSRQQMRQPATIFSLTSRTNTFMIAILSPAKTLDFETRIEADQTKARLFSRSKPLLEVLRTKTDTDLSELMGISEKLALLNLERYHQFSTMHTAHNSKQCLYAFQGDVYQGLKAETLSAEDIDWAQDHLRILSGLYGLLRPMDLIQPYRLEMGTALEVDGHKNLYGYWGTDITELINKDLKHQGDDLLVNLASVEYFKSVNRRALKARIIDVEFTDYKNGKYKIISFFAKKARGLMARYIIENRISKIEDLHGFDYEGYSFDPEASAPYFLTFRRDQLKSS